MNIGLIESNRTHRISECEDLWRRYPGCIVNVYGGFEQALEKYSEDRLEILFLGKGTGRTESEEFIEYVHRFVPHYNVENIV